MDGERILKRNKKMLKQNNQNLLELHMPKGDWPSLVLNKLHYLENVNFSNII